MLDALLMDQADFVELFLENGVQLKTTGSENDFWRGMITLYQVSMA